MSLSSQKMNIFVYLLLFRKYIRLAMSNHLLYYIPIPEEIKTGNDFQLPFCMKDLHFRSAVLMTHNKKTPEIKIDMLPL